MQGAPLAGEVGGDPDWIEQRRAVAECSGRGRKGPLWSLNRCRNALKSQTVCAPVHRVRNPIDAFVAAKLAKEAHSVRLKRMRSP
jgi:hypothetical protein